jgi:hypothetical protein
MKKWGEFGGSILYFALEGYSSMVIPGYVSRVRNDHHS